MQELEGDQVLDSLRDHPLPGAMGPERGVACLAPLAAVIDEIVDETGAELHEIDRIALQQEGTPTALDVAVERDPAPELADRAHELPPRLETSHELLLTQLEHHEARIGTRLPDPAPDQLQHLVIR